MCRKRFVRISLVLLLALCLLPAFSQSLGIAPLPSSSLTSQQVEQLWSELLATSQSLPVLFANYQASLKAQISSLTASNQSLTDSNQSLTALLKQSQQQATTSANALKLSQADLDSSIARITDAQKEAKLIGLRLGFFKVGFYVSTTIAASFGVYELGRTRHWWN